MKSKKIGVLMGGASAEREVSLRSGAAVYNALKYCEYDAVSVDVGKDLCSVLKKQKIDIAFIALHGGQGENGAVQGMLEMMGIPYTGSGILSSALAMDKEASKKIFLYHGLPVPPFFVVQNPELGLSQKSEDTGNGLASGENCKTLCGDTGQKIDFPFPWVIKPGAEGSSVGVEIVKSRKKFRNAVQKALSYGKNVLVEKYIKGKEVQIAILNNEILGGVEVRPSLEFYSYEAKYTSGLTTYILPPKIVEKTYKIAKDAALTAHKVLGCSGATRVDIIIDRSGSPFLLEVNTIPGLTETSLLPMIAKHAGIEFGELIIKILGNLLIEN